MQVVYKKYNLHYYAIVLLSQPLLLMNSAYFSVCISNVIVVVTRGVESESGVGGVACFKVESELLFKM